MGEPGGIEGEGGVGPQDRLTRGGGPVGRDACRARQSPDALGVGQPPEADGIIPGDGERDGGGRDQPSPFAWTYANLLAAMAVGALVQA
jgi:hypothetical protein